MYSKIFNMFEKPVIDDPIKFLCFAFGFTWDGEKFWYKEEICSPSDLLAILNTSTQTCQILAEVMARGVK